MPIRIKERESLLILRNRMLQSALMEDRRFLKNPTCAGGRQPVTKLRHVSGVLYLQGKKERCPVLSRELYVQTRGLCAEESGSVGIRFLLDTAIHRSERKPEAEAGGYASTEHGAKGRGPPIRLLDDVANYCDFGFAVHRFNPIFSTPATRASPTRSLYLAVVLSDRCPRIRAKPILPPILSLRSSTEIISGLGGVMSSRIVRAGARFRYEG